LRYGRSGLALKQARNIRRANVRQLVINATRPARRPRPRSPSPGLGLGQGSGSRITASDVIARLVFKPTRRDAQKIADEVNFTGMAIEDVYNALLSEGVIGIGRRRRTVRRTEGKRR
jgi:hypothetical protein